MSDAAARTHTPEPMKKLLQLQIERLKTEDDEEQWISGEELYTEGSSDEDDTATRVKRKGREERARMHRKMKEMREKVDVICKGKHAHRKEMAAKESLRISSASPITQNDPTQPEGEGNERKGKEKDHYCDRLSAPEVLDTKAEGEKPDECNEASGGVMLSQPEISWRPKRGSIKLPSLNYEGRVELVSNPQVQ